VGLAMRQYSTGLEFASRTVEWNGLSVRKVNSVADKTCATSHEVLFCNGALAELVILNGAERATIGAWGGVEE
jgi:hypothetical protein